MNFKQEIEKIKTEKNRCAALYPDWKDDKYNCGANKFIWGITDSDKEAESFEDLSVLYIYFNRDSKQYFLQLDAEKIWFKTDKLCERMSEWLTKNNHAVTPLKSFFEHVSEFNDGLQFCAPTLELLYQQFVIFSAGVQILKEKLDYKWCK